MYQARCWGQGGRGKSGGKGGEGEGDRVRERGRVERGIVLGKEEEW